MLPKSATWRGLRIPLIVSFFMLLLLPGLRVGAQSCDPVFKKIYGGAVDDEAFSIIYTNDKGSVLVGQTNSGTAGDYDAHLTKLDEYGNIVWSKRWGGAADDQFTKIKSLAAGGYILLGNSKSFGNGLGEVIIGKLDNAGNLLWIKKYGRTGEKTRAKDIIELADGSFVVLANNNDSTAQSDGIVTRADAAGNIIWTKTFDHNGGDDGVAFAMQDGNNLYVTGHATLSDKDGILMKLDIGNGNLLSVKKFHNGSQQHESLLNIYKVPGGVAFGVFTPLGLGARLALFKMKDDGTILYSRDVDVSTQSGTKIGSVNMITSIDGGFVYVVQDTTPWGNAKAVMIGPTGNSEWGQELYSSWGQASRMTGIDRNAGNGYLFAGTTRVFENLLWRNKIAVFKTDRNGSIKPCTLGWIGAWVDTVHYTIVDFTWGNMRSGGYNSQGNLPVNSTGSGFAVSAACEQTSCVGGLPVQAGCSSSYFSSYQSTRSYRAWDVAALADGSSVMVGMQNHFATVEPFVTMLAPNGDVRWSNTYNSFAHTAFFKKVLPASDGNLVVLGADEIVIDHQVWDSTLLMKIDANTGSVIWAKYFMGQAYDIAKTPDGGFIICINRGSTFLYSFVIRLDSSGNIVWQKEYRYSHSSTLYRGITVTGNSVYLAADGSQTDWRLHILKLNASDGSRVWSKLMTLPSQSFGVTGINAIADSIYITLHFRTGPNQVQVGMMSLDAAGTVKKLFKINTLNILTNPYVYNFNSHMATDLLKTSDNNFLIANQTLQSNDTSFSVVKFNPSGTVLWSRRYPGLRNHSMAGIDELAGSFFIAGFNYLGAPENSQVYHSFLMKTESDGSIANAASGACFSESFTATSVDITYEDRNDDLVSVLPVSETPSIAVPFVRNILTWAEMNCNNNNASCGTVGIQGETTLCGISDTLTYTAVRTAGCNTPVSWQIDAANTRVISSTDTSISVKFLTIGATQIIAILNIGCMLVKDTLHIGVRQHADTVSLGADTSLCPGNRLILRAGSDFKDYQWQDGSAEDTLLITAPGLYHVQVTDSCGNRAKDSILVSQAAPVYVNAGPDLLKCNADTVQVIAEPGFLTYQWSPAININPLNSASIALWPATTTEYYLKAEKTPGCFAYDTIKITVNHSVPIQLGGDTSLCSRVQLTLDAGGGFASYLWNTGGDTRSITVDSQGAFSVKATDQNGCSSTDSIRILEIYALPSPGLDRNPNLCFGTTRILNAGNFESYVWQDGSRSPYFTVSSTGTYSVSVTDSKGCKGYDTVSVRSIIQPFFNFLPADSSMCFFSPEKLKAVTGFKSYLWSTGSTSTSISISRPGKYWLRGTDQYGCESIDSVEVKAKECLTGLFIPSAFTPNGDGSNDLLKAMLFGSIEWFELSIYNRYGQLVFTTTDLSKGWDGRIKGVAQETGGFVWLCRYKFNGQPVKIEKGSTILIR